MGERRSMTLDELNEEEEPPIKEEPERKPLLTLFDIAAKSKPRSYNKYFSLVVNDATGRIERCWQDEFGEIHIVEE